MKCNFIGIGVQKSASTWVYRVLEDHPEASMSTPKELDFFSENFNKGFEWYENHFLLDGSKKVAGDISPSYFTSLEAIKNAKQYNPDLKIIVTLRDPIARAYSNHLHLIRLGAGKYKGEDETFESGLAAHPEYMDRSHYFKHLKNWFSNFPKENILVVLQEEIEKETVEHAKIIYSFLGIDQNHQSSFLLKRANVSAEPKIKFIEESLKAAAKFLRKAGLYRVVETIKSNYLIKKFREKNRKHLSSRVPAMQKETEDALLREINKDLTDLSSLLDRDFSLWDSSNKSKNAAN